MFSKENSVKAMYSGSFCINDGKLCKTFKISNHLKFTINEFKIDITTSSYLYQKLTDSYPTLKQHILNYIIPIAGSQDEDIIRSGDPVLKLITSAISDKLKACMLSVHM
jgi:hypothetical protein